MLSIFRKKYDIGKYILWAVFVRSLTAQFDFEGKRYMYDDSQKTFYQMITIPGTWMLVMGMVPFHGKMTLVPVLIITSIITTFGIYRINNKDLTIE